MNDHLQYVLQIADNSLMIGQRLSEWCGHGPVLEDDIALTNIALDHLGLARLLFDYAAELKGEDFTGDEIAFLRDSWQYVHVLLAEQENKDFAYTAMRQFIFDSFQFHFLQALTNSQDQRLADIAEKSLKETKYHLRYSTAWVKRLGDGTSVSHQRIQKAVNDLWPYSGELVIESDADRKMKLKGIGPDLDLIHSKYFQCMQDVLETAHLIVPQNCDQHTGGKNGIHTEKLGYILAELQYLQRTYPQNNW